MRSPSADRALSRPPDAPLTRQLQHAEAKAVWKIRDRAHAPRGRAGMPPRWEGWDDASVAPDKLGPYLRDLRRLLDEYNYQAAYYGHFGHGCIHMQVSFDLQSEPASDGTASSSIAPPISS